jgi:hypothetical protein
MNCFENGCRASSERDCSIYWDSDKISVLVLATDISSVSTAGTIAQRRLQQNASNDVTSKVSSSIQLYTVKRAICPPFMSSKCMTASSTLLFFQMTCSSICLSLDRSITLIYLSSSTVNTPFAFILAS